MLHVKRANMRKGANKRIPSPGLGAPCLHDDGAYYIQLPGREKEEDDVGQDDSSHQRATHTAGSTASIPYRH